MLTNNFAETSTLEDAVYYNMPTWDEQFDFYLDSLDYPLELKIVERDKFGDHFIGHMSMLYSNQYETPTFLNPCVIRPIGSRLA